MQTEITAAFLVAMLSYRVCLLVVKTSPRSVVLGGGVGSGLGIRVTLVQSCQ